MTSTLHWNGLGTSFPLLSGTWIAEHREGADGR